MDGGFYEQSVIYSISVEKLQIVQLRGFVTLASGHGKLLVIVLTKGPLTTFVDFE